MTQDFPDVEGAVKAAAKVALPSVFGHVFYAVPAGQPGLPLLTVSQISGGPDEGEAPTASIRLTFACWGANKLEAVTLKRALVSWLRGLNNVNLDPTCFCYGVTFIAETWLPDDEAQLARYVVDATFTVRSA